jgi:cyclic beta-1,2-glucan synthetase
LQPRVSISLESASRSRFVRIFSGNTGIDPYTTAISDVYQDLFGEGSFTGKGLYDVDAFQTTLNDRVPENALLSHDLFESLFARAALTTEIELLDDYPRRTLHMQNANIAGTWRLAASEMAFFQELQMLIGKKVPEHSSSDCKVEGVRQSQTKSCCAITVFLAGSPLACSSLAPR